MTLQQEGTSKMLMKSIDIFPRKLQKKSQLFGLLHLP